MEIAPGMGLVVYCADYLHIIYYNQIFFISEKL